MIFDLDGTLIDTAPLILASCRHVFALEPGSEHEASLPEMFGLPLAQGMALLYERLGYGQASEATVQGLVRRYREHNLAFHDELIRPFPGVAEVLEALAGRGYRLAVATSKQRPTALRGLRHFGLDRWVEVVVAADDCMQHKPHPEPVLRAAAGLGVPARAALYVGDTPVDVAAGRAAGSITVGAAWGAPHPALAASAPDHLLLAVEGLLGLLADGVPCSNARGGE